MSQSPTGLRPPQRDEIGVKKFKDSRDWRGIGIKVGSVAGVVLGGIVATRYGIAPLWRANDKLPVVKEVGAAIGGTAAVALGAGAVLERADRLLDEESAVGRKLKMHRSRRFFAVGGLAIGAALFIGAEAKHDDAKDKGSIVTNTTVTRTANTASTSVAANSNADVVASTVAGVPVEGAHCSIMAPITGTSEEAQASADALELWLTTAIDPDTGVPYMTLSLADLSDGHIEDGTSAIVDQLQIDLQKIDPRVNPADKWDKPTCEATGPLGAGGLWLPA